MGTVVCFCCLALFAEKLSARKRRSVVRDATCHTFLPESLGFMPSRVDVCLTTRLLASNRHNHHGRVVHSGRNCASKQLFADWHINRNIDSDGYAQCYR